MVASATRGAVSLSGMLVTPLSPLGIPRLGVNVDHVATVRQARGGIEPDPVAAAVLAEQAGAEGITVHLREDRRHIQERDVRVLRGFVQHLNLELAAEVEVVRIATDIAPQAACLVPEKREEITTEGGLDCTRDQDRLAAVVEQLAEVDAQVSIFIDPDVRQLRAAHALGAQCVELHTGRYAESRPGPAREAALSELRMAALAGREIGLMVHAGHGLDYRNVGPVAQLEGIEELNIGHSIVSRAVFVGFERAVLEMRRAIERAVLGRSAEGEHDGEL
jgi:pyridoxine 5-phosphate synthase